MKSGEISGGGTPPLCAVMEAVSLLLAWGKE
jgi:hypothetical protein